MLSIVLGLGAGFCLDARSSELLTKRSEVVAQAHWAGFDQLNESGHATTLKEVWQLPATMQLREHVFQKLAHALAASFHPHAGRAGSNCAALIRPLLDDLAQREAYAEVRRQGNHGPVCMLAIHLSAERVRLWETNCSQLFAGWDWVTSQGTNHLSYASAKSWFVMANESGWGTSAAQTAATSSLLREIQTKGRPVATSKDSLLKAEVDFSRLGEKLPFFPDANQPRVEITFAEKGSRLRSEARVLLAEPMPWQLEQWRIPINTIHDPNGSLISFTGVQGFAPWLGRQALIRDLGVQPVPNQFFAWGDRHAPFQIQAAAPVHRVADVLARLGTQRMAKANSSLAEFGIGEIQFVTNRFHFSWRGLPIITPYLHPAPEPTAEFLHGGIFLLENVPTNPPPPELLNELTSRTNLLYYDWEITQGRLGQLRVLARYLPLFLDLPTSQTSSPMYQWLDAIEPKLGNTVTELTVVSPRELRLVRNSQIGMNGLELMALSLWLESTNFPRMSCEVSFRRPAKTGKQSAKP